MKFPFLSCFELNGHDAELHESSMLFGAETVALRNGIPRFSEDESYSDGNFALLREQHATLQLDSVNGTSERHELLQERTGWPIDFWAGKLVLECGTGAGPDTECLLDWGANVVSVDIAGSDIAKKNLGDRPNLCLVQASIMDLPLKRKSFDVVFCHRVIQHTPDPEHTLRHILEFVQDDGKVFVHSYARTVFQMLNWKYALRPLTKRMDPQELYNLIKGCAPVLFSLTSFLSKNRLGRIFCRAVIPFYNYRRWPQFKDRSDEWIVEYGVHDTFDALSPKYDNPLSAKVMKDIASKMLSREFEVVEMKFITLLRSK